MSRVEALLGKQVVVTRGTAAGMPPDGRVAGKLLLVRPSADQSSHWFVELDISGMRIGVLALPDDIMEDVSRGTD